MLEKDSPVSKLSKRSGKELSGSNVAKRIFVGITAIILLVHGVAVLGQNAEEQATPGTTPVWTQYGPLARFSHTAVFDPNTQKSIVYGGQQVTSPVNLNDVWVGSTIGLNLSFTQLAPTGAAPAARFGHVATYDANSNRMTIMGGATGGAGSCQNDVWILQNANGQSTPQWINATPHGVAPSQRQYHTAVYDPNANSMIVFGGSDCNSGFLNDVWILNFANGVGGTPSWTKLAPSGSLPPAREKSTAIYDPIHNSMTVYAGDALGDELSDVWLLSHANGTGGTPTWTQLFPTGTAPSARTAHSAFYDSVSNRMIIYGGFYLTATLGDTWALTFPNNVGGAPAWVEVKPQGTAPTLGSHTAVYNSTTNSMDVFGGTSTTVKLMTSDHFFTLNDANGVGIGSLKWNVDGPPVRYSHSSFYDASTDTLTVFAGAHSDSGLLFNDIWQQSGVFGSSNLTWAVSIPDGTLPSPRYGHSGVYDPGTQRMMVFGGGTGKPAPCVNDYWVLQNAASLGEAASWLSVAVTGKVPAARYRHASAYDAVTNSLIIFGGFDCNKTYFNDVWVLSNANSTSGNQSWTNLKPQGSLPQVRENVAVAYDSTSNTMMVFGGDKGRTYYSDIWVLSHANGQGGSPTWTQLTATNQGPSKRSELSATYDATNNRMTIYSGFDGTNILTEAWVLIGANGTAGAPTWSMLTPTVAGPPRRWHTANYDPVTNQMIIFGGSGATKPLTPEGDIFSLTVANGLP